MKGWKRSVLAILVLLMLFGFSAVNVANAAKSEIVSDVLGLRDYVPMNDSFTRGSTLRVYTEMSDVNYDGFVFVSLVFIIEDPRGHVVSMDRIDITRRDYVDDVYYVYSKAIPSWWLYGKYELDIYAYDRLNKVKIMELERKVETNTLEELIDNEDDFEDLEELFETACGGDEDALEDLGVIKSFSDSRKEITHIKFFVCREEEIIFEPAKPPEVEKIKAPLLTVTDVRVDKFKVKPDESVSISVTVKNAGIRGTEKVTLVINGEKEAEQSVTLDYMESKTLFFPVKKSLPGTYKVTIPGTDIVRLFFVEENHVEGEEKTGNFTSTLSEAEASPNSGLPIHVFFVIGIAFIVILAVVIILLRFHFHSKPLNFSRFRR